MQVFVGVSEDGGFKATARRLGMSPAAVTRAIAALEKRLGVTLFERTTRTVRLTEAGDKFLPLCRRILENVEEAEAYVSRVHREPRGTISITAPSLFGQLYGAPMVFEYLKEYPQVCARMVFVDRIVNLVTEGIDVGIRIADLADSTLTAVRVGSVRSVICASPEYLERRGVPRCPSDLKDHDAIGFSPTRRPGAPWGFSHGCGDGKSEFELATPRTRLTMNSVDIAIAAAVRGLGITRVLSYQVAREIEDGRLVGLMEDYDATPIPIHIVYPAGRRASMKVRKFVRHATTWLRNKSFSSIDARHRQSDPA